MVVQLQAPRTWSESDKPVPFSLSMYTCGWKARMEKNYTSRPKWMYLSRPIATKMLGVTRYICSIRLIIGRMPLIIGYIPLRVTATDVQMSVGFDRNNCTSLLHLHLQVTSLMLFRTTCSFYGNDSRRVDWLRTGDCRQSDQSVEKNDSGPGLY